MGGSGLRCRGHGPLTASTCLLTATGAQEVKKFPLLREDRVGPESLPAAAKGKCPWAPMGLTEGLQRSMNLDRKKKLHPSFHQPFPDAHRPQTRCGSRPQVGLYQPKSGQASQSNTILASSLIPTLRMRERRMGRVTSLLKVLLVNSGSGFKPRSI